MTYILAEDELTVPVYTSRPKKTPPRRRHDSSESPSKAPQRRRITTSETSSDGSIKSESTNASPAVEDVVFPSHEPIRPVFCCTSVKTKDSEYAYKLGSTTSTLQRGRMCIFRNYIAEYSQSKGIPVNEDLHWPVGADYLVKVVQYREAEEPQSLSPRKERKMSPAKKSRRLGKGNDSKHKDFVEWEQAAPGRYFVETKHKKGKRRPCHAFDEILITESLEGIPACFERVGEINMEVMCPVHSENNWVCEFWGKVAGD